MSEYFAGETTLRSKPDIISIESTNYCNLKCIMCPRGEPDIMERELGSMSDDVFRRIVTGWYTYADPTWFHMMGEPLMHQRLFAQIEIAKAAGVENLAMSTNATLLSERNADLLAISNLDAVILCIDGNDKETYEAIRKSTEFSYEEVCDNVRRFLAKKRGFSTPRATVQIIVTDETRSQLEEFKAKWLAAGADEVVFKPFALWAGQDSRFASLAPADRIDELGAVREHPCFYLWQGVTVCWDGRVVPCCYDFDATMTMGNLTTQSLSEVWNSPKYVDLRRKERDRENDSKLCVNCTEAPGYPLPVVL